MLSELEFKSRITLEDLKRQVASPTERILEIPFCNVVHSNFVTITKAERFQKELHVKNFFTVCGEEGLQKVAEIQIEDSIVRITDRYMPMISTKKEGYKSKASKEGEIDSLGDNQQQSKAFVKKYEVRRKQEFPGVKNYKNTHRNIFRLFQNWLQDYSNSNLQQQKYQALEILRKANGRFSKRLFSEMNGFPLLRKSFIIFSRAIGPQIIQKSKILHKAEHLETLYAVRDMLEGEIAEETKRKEEEEKERQSINQGEQVVSCLKVEKKGSLKDEANEQMNQLMEIDHFLKDMI